MSAHYKIYCYAYWIYIFSGIWHYNSSVKWKMNIYRFYVFVLALIYAIISVTFMIDAYQVRHDLEKLSFNLTSSFLLFGSLAKGFLLLRNKGIMEEILDKLENHLYVTTVGESPEDVEIFTKAAGTYTKINKVLYAMLVVGFPLRVAADSAFNAKQYLIPLPYKDKVTNFEVMYAAQLVMTAHFLTSVVAHDILIYGVVIRFIAHFTILENNITKIKYLYPRMDFKKYIPEYVECEESSPAFTNVLLSKDNNKDNIQNLLQKCGFEKVSVYKWVNKRPSREKKTYKILIESVVHHQKLLAQIKVFYEIYSLSAVVSITLTALLTAAVSLQIILLSTKITPLLMQQVIYVFTSMLNVLFVCTFGNEITSKSETTADVLYDTPWYEMDFRNRYVIYLILKRLIDAPKPKAGGMIPINLRSYLSLIEKSYNLVTVLKQV